MRPFHSNRQGAQTRNGFVLATALVVSVVLLVIGLGYLGFTSNDYLFSGRLHNSTRAFYLAWAGLQYYQAEGLPKKDVNGNCVLTVDDAQHLCRLEQQGSTLVFRGQISDGYGRILAERVLVAPGGNLSQWYEAVR